MMWAATLAGVVLVALALVDAYSTIFHYDADGPIGHGLRRFAWSALIRIAGSRRRLRRVVLGAAGPVLVGATFLFWIGTYIVGFALIVWPHLETAYRSEAELALGSFVDALYYSGITASVLGYGDITPTTGVLKVLAFVESSLGFLLFTATVTHGVTLLSGLTERNALGNRVRGMSGGRWEGGAMVLRLLPSGSAELASRIRDLSSDLGEVEEKLHHFPVLDLYYRSQEADRDPEPMLACLAETVLALYVLAQTEPLLRPPAEELASPLEEIMLLLLRTHASQAEQAAFREVEPDQRDRRRLEEIRRALLDSGHVTQELAGLELPVHALAFAARARTFLAALDRHTRWRLDHGSAE